MDQIFCAITMKNISKRPLFKEIWDQRLFDFNAIIPVPDIPYRDESSLCMEKWGTTANTLEAKIVSDDEVVFHVSGGVPFPVIKKLSEMYPDTPVHFGYMPRNSTEVITINYLNGKVMEEKENA